MKLPEDKNERRKVIALICIGSAAVIFGMIQGISAFSKSKKNKKADLATVEDRLVEARKQIRKIPQDLEMNQKTIADILTISEKNILEPVFGTYQLGAKKIIEEQLKKFGLTPSSIREVGRLEIPESTGNVKAYTVRVSLECSYHDLIKITSAFEKNNPYLSICDMGIRGQSEQNLEKHLASFTIQWPIWSQADMAQKLKEQLKETSGSKKEKK